MASDSASEDKRPIRRIPAVDILRGLAIAFMILVNNPGDYLHIYPLLMHSRWHGFTPVDMVFPFFLFLVGVSIAITVKRRELAGVGRGGVLARALRRAAVLFGLGLIDNGFPAFDLKSLRIPGVLQRIGIVSFLATLVGVRLTSRSVLAVIAGGLLLYWLLLAVVPVPDVGKPDLSLQNVNISAWMDVKLLGGHLWVHEDEWDPEGILSTVPALCIALFGLLAGRGLLAGDAAKRTAGRFVLYGILLVGGGLLWGLWFPINRWLWTSSFVLFVSGLALAALGLCLLVPDRGGVARALTPFRIYGENAITLYMVSSLLSKCLFLARLPGGQSLHEAAMTGLLSPWLPPESASLAWALGFTALLYLLAWSLHAQGVRIRV